MFHKLKQFKELRQQAKSLQNMLAEERVEVNNKGIRLVMDGNQHVLSLNMNRNLTVEEIEKYLPGIINEAIKKAQHVMAKKMRESGQLKSLGL